MPTARTKGRTTCCSSKPATGWHKSGRRGTLRDSPRLSAPSTSSTRVGQTRWQQELRLTSATLPVSNGELSISLTAHESSGVCQNIVFKDMLFSSDESSVDRIVFIIYFYSKFIVYIEFKNTRCSFKQI